MQQQCRNSGMFLTPFVHPRELRHCTVSRVRYDSQAATCRRFPKVVIQPIGQGQFSMMRISSFCVASLLSRLARQLTTHTLPGTYPLRLFLRSIVGELFFIFLDPRNIGMPSNGHFLGMEISSIVIVHVRPYIFARSRAFLSSLLRGSLSQSFLFQLLWYPVSRNFFWAAFRWGSFDRTRSRARRFSVCCRSLSRSRRHLTHRFSRTYRSVLPHFLHATPV